MSGITGVVKRLKCCDGLIRPFHNLAAHRRGGILAADMGGVNSAAGKGPVLIDHAGVIFHEERTGNRFAVLPLLYFGSKCLGQGFLAAFGHFFHGQPDRHSLQGGNVDAAGLAAAETATPGAGTALYQVTGIRIKGFVYLF